MGQFTVRVKITSPGDRERFAEADLPVDTGATLSWVPRELIEKLSLPLLRRRPFRVADGRVVERDTAGAIVQLNGIDANVTIVVAEPGDGLLLGATALESLGFGVDPVHRRLIPQELLAM